MVVEELKEKRLRDFGLNIKTKFKDGDMILERNTNHSKDDNIKDGVILEKDYYRDQTLLKKENIFDSRITYCYEFNDKEDVVCKNCGMTGNLSDFNNGCPYCHSAFNMEYHKKELGSKHYYDLTIKSKKYIIITYIIDFLVSFLITLTYIIDTSRTFYLFDMLKVLIGTVLISLLLFYVFYYIDAIIILPGIKKWKMAQNKLQENFWESMNYTEENKTRFYNNINYCLRTYYFGEEEKDVIDFDIIDYDSLKKEEVNNQLFVNVKLDIRIVRYKEGKVVSKRESITYRFRKVEKSSELQGGMNLMECPGCGSSIKVADEKCEYCGTKINYYQEWYLDSVIG